MNASASEILVEFGSAGNASRFCREGWSVPEPEERWAIGSSSRLELPAPPGPEPCFLVMTLRPFLSVPAGLAAQRLGVTVNGTRVADFLLRRTERTRRACRIPVDLTAGRDTIEIRLETPDAASPARIEQGTDARQLAFAFTSMRLHPDAAEPAGPGAAEPGGSEPPGSRELMYKFESLGQNCEFGLVQRGYSAEPLGLLRFASTPLPHLLSALDARFEGLGSPGSIAVEVSATGREYMIADRRYGLLYHAWVKVGEMAPEDILRREQRRIPILVRKLLEDLTGAEKIFVFKGLRAVCEEQVMPLVAAIRRYAPNTLLLVTLADADHPPGTIEARGPGLIVGYLDRFAPEENAHDLSLEPWLRLCRNAYRLRLTGASER